VVGLVRKLGIWAAEGLLLLALTGGISSGARADEPVFSPAPEPAAIDYRAEMIRLVAAIAQRGRQVNPDFGVFPQNGSELGASPEYLSIVTGIGQEDIYYGYIRNGKATPGEDTLYLEANLDRFRDAGKRVLTLDYPFSNKNNPSFSKSTRKKIDSAYAQSSTRGYVPYAAVLNLNRLVVSPGHEPRANEPPVTGWDQVKEWAVQLQPARGQSRAGFLEDLGKSGFDLLVIDYSFDGSGEGEFTAQEIAGLKASLKGKVLAYLSIGEAEDYRWYWQSSWDARHDGRPDPGAPPWLGRENPDWKGNYQVQYWNPDWQAIVLSYLDRILTQGFDGVYLDLVDAYETYE
jgi:cysteinyl-tRNA synthetase